MKIYARQIAPEYQKSPLFNAECFPEDIAVCGNRNYIEHCPEVFQEVRRVLVNGELAKILNKAQEWVYWYKDAEDAINDYLPPVNKMYSVTDIKKLTASVVHYAECSYQEEDQILCNVLSIVTGEDWKVTRIHGCCQSEWNYVFYPADNWNYRNLRVFESEYFNTGSEWIIHEGDFNPETDSPADIDGYYVYCTSWDNDGLRKEIASAAGVNPEDVTLYSFEGWTRTAVYERM